MLNQFLIRRSLCFLLFLITFGGVGLSESGAAGGEAGKPTSQVGTEAAIGGKDENALKVGYLLSGSDLEPVRPLVEQLIQALKENAAVRAAMNDLDYVDIWPRQCDGSFDMIQRLDAEEFDLAFATAVIYARQFHSRPDAPEEFQRVAYEPIFQFKRLLSDFMGPRDIGVYRKGVIFVGPGSPLWGIEPSDEQIRAAIESEWMAVPDSNSAGGYIYPRLVIEEKFSGISPHGPIFCRSSEEVVKHVASGLISIGACEERFLEGPLGTIQTADGKTIKAYQELLRTLPIPTDPILLRADLLPSNTDLKRAALGREIKALVQTYFNEVHSPAPDLKAHPVADRRPYEDMARALKKFDSTVRSGAGRASTKLAETPQGSK